ncbi:MAG: ASCH domain-containing protein [Chitinophagales bacterium]|nr:ASCH domain-containing protein [Chitinophagales bacterium]
MWNDFLKQNPSNKTKDLPTAFYFCDNEKSANECAELVVKGIKQATVGALFSYEINNEALPKVGEQFIVTDWNGNAKAIIETTNVTLTPYNKITATFAALEGEGDKSLAYWKRVHKAFFTREMQSYDLPFDENMILVCETFKTIYKVE